MVAIVLSCRFFVPMMVELNLWNMIRELSRRLLLQLESELEEISFGSMLPIERLDAAMGPIRSAMKKLSAFVLDKPFTGVEQEVEFFKLVKPGFSQWQYYFQELYTIEENLPFGEPKLQELYLENEMVYVQRFFREHQFHYQYYRRGAVELDGVYFTLEGSRGDSRILPLGMEVSEGFSRPGELIFARLMAFEKLRDWLQERISFLKGNEGKPFFEGRSDEELYWTGESINLAEVAVGLHRTGQLNNGSASIGAIFRWLEKQLHVSIGVPSKRLSEIKRRTKFSKLRFLEEMKEECLRSFEKEDEYGGET